MAKTQKNKATSYHLGQLKAKLAKLKRELLTPSSSGGGGGAGFDVARTGVASGTYKECCLTTAREWARWCYSGRSGMRTCG
jgi:hypothetical protein